MISAGKGPSPAKPNLPKQNITPVINAANTPPSMPFSGQPAMDEQRSNMAMGMLAPKPAQPMQYKSPDIIGM